jgi:hypothetical protein
MLCNIRSGALENSNACSEQVKDALLRWVIEWNFDKHWMMCAPLSKGYSRAG